MASGAATDNRALSGLNELSSLRDADPRDLSQQQISLFGDFLKSSLYHFAWFICEFHQLIPELHGKLAALLGKWGQPGYTRIMIQLPREFFKTSLCTIANPLWQITRDPDSPVAIFNEKEGNAAMWVRTIRDIAANSLLFQTLYPDLLPPGIGINATQSMPRSWKWNDFEITFQRNRIQPEASITALGIGSASAGRHWPKIIKDDLISEDAIRSESVMNFAKDWFDKSLYLERPATKGWDLIPCTSWGYNDLYAHVLRTYDYVLYRRAALENEQGEPDIAGESIFPQKLTTAELRVQAERDPYGYSAQMQNMPMPGRDRQFDPKWIRWGQASAAEENPEFIINTECYDPDIVGDPRLFEKPPPSVPLRLMRKALLFDPAPTESAEIARSKSARNGVDVIGKDPWGRVFVLESWASRTDPQSVITKLFSLMRKWGTCTLGIEEVNFSKLYRFWILADQYRHKFPVNIIKLPPGKRDKDTRISRLIPGFRQGLYYFNFGQTVELVKEVAEYPYGETRDCLDALAYDYKIGRPSSPEENYVEFAQKRTQVLGRNPVTGY